MELKPKKSKFFYKVRSEDLKYYEEKAVYFSKPRLVAYWDYNYGKLTNAKRMKYLKIPQLCHYPIDLNYGFEKLTIRSSDMGLKHIEFSLKYEMSSAAKNYGVEDVDKTKVITRRGTLVRLMEMMCKKFAALNRIRVSRYRNNLYMIHEENCDEEPHELKPVHMHHQRLAKVLFADLPNLKPNGLDPCDENIMLCCVHRSKFGKYDMIYSGEVQGIMEDEAVSNFDDLDEISDRRFVFTKQMWETLRHKDLKYLDYWLQSYLGNVRDIFIGFKDSTGVINKPIKHILVKDMPKNRSWKPSICTGFLYQFMQNVEKLMSSVNCLNTVYLFEFNPKTSCFTYDIFEGKTEKSFISEEYQSYCKNYFN